MNPNCPLNRSLKNSLWTEKTARQLSDAICQTYHDDIGIDHIDDGSMPERSAILTTLKNLLEILFPGYSGDHCVSRSGLSFTVGELLNQTFRMLAEQIRRAHAYRCDKNCQDLKCDCLERAEETTLELLKKLPEIRETLRTDAKAALDGDPAARTTDEIVIAYPGMRAIAIHRLAHELYLAQVPLIPRVMSEYAHALTGIDIHPGASIGRNFFIDHGTGVVIGETAVIGESVKIYQGVTLGALSFPKDACGKLIKGAKRHPNIEDGVTIYAGATILGDITIGAKSVIGGNVWLTESVPPETKVTISAPELSIRTRDKKKNTKQ